jgi:hypothetical protein
MSSFIRIAEIWQPSSDGTQLELTAGLFGEALSFAAQSRPMAFARGEGLPGQAWAEGRPILLKDFTAPQFHRTEAALALGLSFGLALPVFRGDALQAVVVLFGGNTADATAGAAVELWRNDPRITGDLTLVDGFYGRLPGDLEAASHDTFLPRGAGLPGLAWQREGAVFMDELGRSRRFLRADTAQAAGIRQGLAMPCTATGLSHHVVTFLSTSDTPLARRSEGWVAAPDGQNLQRDFGQCAAQGGLPTGAAGPHLPLAGDGLIARVWASGLPALVSQASGQPDGVGAAASAAGLDSLIALPVFDAQDEVSEVVALYL